MKKLVLIVLAAALILPLVGSQARAKKEEQVKIDICHVISANDVIPFYNVFLYFGKVKSVDESAVDAHLAHGDFTNFWGGDEAAGPINAFREAGAQLPAANCYFGVTADGVPYGPPE